MKIISMNMKMLRTSTFGKDYLAPMKSMRHIRAEIEIESKV